MPGWLFSSWNSYMLGLGTKQTWLGLMKMLNVNYYLHDIHCMIHIMCVIVYNNWT